MRLIAILALSFLLGYCTTSRVNTTKNDVLSPQDRLSNARVLTTKTGCRPSSWSSDGQRLAFWNDHMGRPICSKAYVLDLNDPELEMGNATQIGPGFGRVFDPEFLPGDSLLMLTTTHQYEIKECEGDSVAPFFARMRSMQSIFTTTVYGEMRDKIIASNAVDGQARISPNGDKLIFISSRAASYGIWRSLPDGSNPNPVIVGFYFAGEPQFSPNGEHIVFRGRQSPPEGYEGYLTADIDLRHSDLYMCKWDGTSVVRLTNLKAATANPVFHPDGNHIIFSSNHHRDDGKRNLFMLNIENNTLQQITTGDADETHPIVHPDGKRIAYSAVEHGDREVFLADLKMD